MLTSEIAVTFLSSPVPDCPVRIIDFLRFDWIISDCVGSAYIFPHISHSLRNLPTSVIHILLNAFLAEERLTYFTPDLHIPNNSKVHGRSNV